MVRAASWLVLVACSGPRAPDPIENRASSRTGVHCARAKGKIVEVATREPALGATIVFSGSGPGEDVVITDEHGAFDTPVQADRTTITVYYADRTHTEPFTACEGILIQLATTPSGRSNSNLP
jgi:hypothetical protein